MSDEPQKVPFGQTTGGIILIQGVVTAVVSVVVTWLINNAADLPWLLIAAVFVGVAVVVFVVLSLFSKRLRKSIWVRFGKWLRGTWPVTTRTKERAVVSAFQAGIDSEKEKVAAERAQARNPQWHIDGQDRLGEHDLLWLENHGAQVKDVVMTCDPALFVLDGDVSWTGTLGTDGPGYEGKQFRGQPTELGRTQGVIFHVVWYDMNGDRHEGNVTYPPKEMRARDQEIHNEAWAEGREAGRAEVLAELEAAQPAPPPIKPRWVLVQDHTDNAPDDGWIVANMAKGAVALHVSLDAPREELVFLSAADWPDMTGKSQQNFSGYLTSRGESYGVTFKIEWTDANGQRKSERIDWEPIG